MNPASAFRFSLVVLSLPVLSALAGCTAQADDSKGSAQDIAQIKDTNDASDATAPTAEKAVERIVELAPIGAYLGATPEGGSCSVTVSNIEQLGKVENVRVTIAWRSGCAEGHETCTANPPFALNFDVHGAAPNLPVNLREYAAETPVSDWKDTAPDAASFTVKYSGYNIAKVEVVAVASEKGSVKSTFTIPNRNMTGGVLECGELKDVDPKTLKTNAQ